MRIRFMKPMLFHTEYSRESGNPEPQTPSPVALGSRFRGSTGRAFMASLSALALAACAVGPDYVAPVPPAASSGPFIAADTPAVSTDPVAENWWRLYDDPVLDGLVRSEERRVGKGCVRTCRPRWAPYY